MATVTTEDYMVNLVLPDHAMLELIIISTSSLEWQTTRMGRLLYCSIIIILVVHNGGSIP